MPAFPAGSYLLHHSTFIIQHSLSCRPLETNFILLVPALSGERLSLSSAFAGTAGRNFRIRHKLNPAHHVAEAIPRF